MGITCRDGLLKYIRNGVAVRKVRRVQRCAGYNGAQVDAEAAERGGLLPSVPAVGGINQAVW